MGDLNQEALFDENCIQNKYIRVRKKIKKKNNKLNLFFGIIISAIIAVFGTFMLIGLFSYILGIGWFFAC